jgi:hypothetical protein
MSELRANTITASDGTSPVTLTKQSALRMMCFYNQSTTTRVGVAQDEVGTSSLNVSTVEDIDTGIYGVNLTNAHSTDDWMFLSGAQATNNTCTRRFDNGASASKVVTNNNDADTNTDQDQASYCATAGDLA